MESSNPIDIMLQLQRTSHGAALHAARLEARKSFPISFNQLRCGEEGKEIRGAIEGKKRKMHGFSDFFTGKFEYPIMENNKYAYRIFNSRKDADSIIMGTYASLLVTNQELYWMDDELDRCFRSHGGMFGKFTTFNAQFLYMVFVLLFVAFFSFMSSVYNIAVKAAHDSES